MKDMAYETISFMNKHKSNPFSPDMYLAFYSNIIKQKESIKFYIASQDF